MVRTRLDTKFQNFSFVLKDDEMFVCLYALSKFCERISYEYCGRHGYTVNCRFLEEQRYDDVANDISYFAKEIYPRLKYIHLDELPMTFITLVNNIEQNTNETERYYRTIFVLAIVYLITTAIAITIAYKQ